MALTKVSLPMIEGFIIDVTGYAVDPTGVADSTAGIQQAIDDNPGQTIYFPSGTYKFSTLTITDNDTKLVGTGCFSNGTVFQSSQTTGNDVVFDGAQHAGISQIYFKPVVKKTSGYAIAFTDSCFKCFANNVRIDYSYSGFLVRSSSETEIFNCSVRYLLGVSGIYTDGTSSIGSYRTVINNFVANNPYPITGDGPIESWSPTTAFSVNDLTTVNGNIWQCTFSGTSGATGPSGIPGTTAENAFTTEITDGSVKWKFVSTLGLNWIVQDSFSYSLVINQAALLNGTRGFYQSDTQNTGSSYPLWCFAWDLEIDHSWGKCVQQDGGEGIYINGSWLGSSLTSDAVLINTNGKGEVYIGGGTRISGCAQHGVNISAGPINVIIDGCYIYANSQLLADTYHGVNVASNATDFQVLNSVIGVSQQSYGVFIGAGTSDNYVIANNNLLGNFDGAINDGGSGTTKLISANLGANPSLLTAISVGASPFSWVNNLGNTATVVIDGATLITLDGYRVSDQTYSSVAVPHGSTLVVTYSSLPTMLYKAY